MSIRYCKKILQKDIAKTVLMGQHLNGQNNTIDCSYLGESQSVAQIHYNSMHIQINLPFLGNRLQKFVLHRHKKRPRILV